MKSGIMIVAVLIGLLCFFASVIQYYENMNVVGQGLTVEYNDGFEIALVENSTNSIVYFFGALFGVILTAVAAVKFMRDNEKGRECKLDGTRLSETAVSNINTTIAVSIVLGVFITGFLHTGDAMLIVFIVAFIAVIVFNLESLGAYIIK